MKRDIIIKPFIGPRETATILIDKDGIRVENKCESVSYRPDSYFFRSFVRNCIDMDEWQHSAHVSIEKAMIKGTEERKKCRKIMQNKIADRENEIKMLKDGMQVLGRC